jgi:peptidoglycan hydrolase CwlO-like protein
MNHLSITNDLTCYNFLVKRTLLFLSVIGMLVVGVSFSQTTYADEYEQIVKELEETRRALESSVSATATNERRIEIINSRINHLKSRVEILEKEVEKKERQISEGDDQFSRQQQILQERIFSHYKLLSDREENLVYFLLSDSLDQALRGYRYQKGVVRENQKTITQIALQVKNIEEIKRGLEVERSRLNAVKRELAAQSAFLVGEVASAKSYQSTLQKKIAELSARQQQILNARSGSFTVNIGDSELADDHNASIKGFRESAPSGYFAVFSFGAHTHRKGMSQYGARGRAQQGKNYREILEAYYGKGPVSKDTSGTLKVEGYGEIDFETTYLYGIAEMPSSWHKEALKAQAVAARSYAYRYKVQGKEICTTESCQVFRKGKSENPPQSWREAVDETRGEVLEDVVAYYSSTAGGFLTTSGWDTLDAAGGSNFVDKAYEKLGGSPWLYKAWYTQGYSVNSEKCGRTNPWLSPEEFADIVNAALVLSKGSSEEVSRVTPVTTSCWGGNPYSVEELRLVASKYGGLTSASSVSVEQGNGTTVAIVVDGIRMSGSDFKRAFNLRAPGHLKIPQKNFAFFNVERKE